MKNYSNAFAAINRANDNRSSLFVLLGVIPLVGICIGVISFGCRNLLPCASGDGAKGSQSLWLGTGGGFVVPAGVCSVYYFAPVSSLAAWRFWDP